MNNTLLKSRKQIKHEAKTRLGQHGTWRDLMLANLLPWLINLVFMALVLSTTWAIMKNYGLHNMANNTSDFVDYYAGKANQVSRQSLLFSFITLWFSKGIALTALDLYRGKAERYNPLKALFRLFNGQYFFGIFAIALLVNIVTQFGYYLFIIPGVIFALGLAMSYYAYYDGKNADHPLSVFNALGQSWRVMRGFKTDYFVLQLSLIGWWLLEQVTFGLFNFIIDPYLQLVDAGFYANLADYHASLTKQA